MSFPAPTFTVAELVKEPHEADSFTGRFYVIETYWTSDGPRTRILGVRTTLEQATDEVARRNARLAGQ